MISNWSNKLAPTPDAQLALLELTLSDMLDLTVERGASCLACARGVFLVIRTMRPTMNSK